MGLNSNAKGLKTDRRLEREIFRREENAGLWPHEPRNPCAEMVSPLVDAWLTAESFAKDEGTFVCMHCWEPLRQDWEGLRRSLSRYNNLESSVACRDDFKDILDYLLKEDSSLWMHAHSMSTKCHRKRRDVARPIPGILIIEELWVA